MRAKKSDNRVDEAVELIRQHGPCTYAFIRERVTKPCRCLSSELLEDKRVQRKHISHSWRWIYLKEERE